MVLEMKEEVEILRAKLEKGKRDLKSAQEAHILLESTFGGLDGREHYIRD